MTTTTTPRAVSERSMRSLLLWLSRRRSLGRLATRTPVSRSMVRRFVSGETLDEALPALERIHAAGLRTTVDVLGESVDSVTAAATAADRYLVLLDAIADRGLDPNVSLKLTQMGLDIGTDTCRANVERVFRKAAEREAFVRIDMEDHTKTDATLALWREVRSVNPASGVVIQAALRRSAADIEALIAERARPPLQGRLQGAGRSPSGRRRRSTAVCAAPLERSRATASTRARDARRAPRPPGDRLRRARGIGPERFEFQMLYGVRRDLQDRLVRDGWTVRLYVPFGREWYPYFMRRLAERPANVGFILKSVLREGRGGEPK
jgi:proline dehydrogenase